MSENGKGDNSRPLSIPRKDYESNWDRIFKKEPDTKKLKEKWEKVLDHKNDIMPIILESQSRQPIDPKEVDAYVKKMLDRMRKLPFTDPNAGFSENSENS